MKREIVREFRIKVDGMFTEEHARIVEGAIASPFPNARYIEACAKHQALQNEQVRLQLEQHAKHMAQLQSYQQKMIGDR